MLSLSRLRFLTSSSPSRTTLTHVPTTFLKKNESKEESKSESGSGAPPPPFSFGAKDPAINKLAEGGLPNSLVQALGNPGSTAQFAERMAQMKDAGGPSTMMKYAAVEMIAPFHSPIYGMSSLTSRRFYSTTALATITPTREPNPPPVVRVYPASQNCIPDVMRAIQAALDRKSLSSDDSIIRVEASEVDNMLVITHHGTLLKDKEIKRIKKNWPFLGIFQEDCLGTIRLFLIVLPSFKSVFQVQSFAQGMKISDLRYAVHTSGMKISDVKKFVPAEKDELPWTILLTIHKAANFAIKAAGVFDWIGSLPL